MHRSGTSALTRVLSLLGAALPKNLLGAGVGNETGHWEPKRLVDLHDEMLTEAGSSWDDWRRLDLAAQLPDGRLDHYKQRIRQLIEEEYGNEPLFVIKEPRICRFVPLYREVLAQIDIDVRPILIVRNPLEVAASLAARNEMAPEQSQLYWLRHVLDAEASTRDIPRAFASYEALLADWRTALPPIAAQLRLIWPREPQSVASEIDAFLSSSHRHHTISVGDLNDDPALSRWVKHANTAIMRLLEDPASSLSELDKLGRDFETATALFSPALTAERMAREQLAATYKAEEERLRAEIEAEQLAHELTQREADRVRARNSLLIGVRSKPLSISIEKIGNMGLNWRTKRWAKAIRASGLLDDEFYLKNNPDVATAHIDPAVHYLRFGALEGRQPSRFFDGDSYLVDNRDVALAGTNPLVHFVLHGAREGRKIRSAT